MYSAVAPPYSVRAPAHVRVVLTNKKCVWRFIAVEKRHSLGVKAQPQPHRQDKGSHQLQDRKQTVNKYRETFSVKNEQHETT